MAEVLWYLKGIKEDDINKIPKDIIKFLKENASKEYICTFDYNKPLNELNLLDDTRGIIGILCYKYWCTTKEQKEMYLKKLNSNEKNYQIKINEKYNQNDLYKRNNHQKEEIQRPKKAYWYYRHWWFESCFDHMSISRSYPCMVRWFNIS